MSICAYNPYISAVAEPRTLDRTSIVNNDTAMPSRIWSVLTYVPRQILKLLKAIWTALTDCLCKKRLVAKKQNEVEKAKILKEAAVKRYDSLYKACTNVDAKIDLDNGPDEFTSTEHLNQFVTLWATVQRQKKHLSELFQDSRNPVTSALTQRAHAKEDKLSQKAAANETQILKLLKQEFERFELLGDELTLFEFDYYCCLLKCFSGYKFAESELKNYEQMSAGHAQIMTRGIKLRRPYQRGQGIPQIGNSCYMNAEIQSVLCLNPLRNHIRYGKIAQRQSESDDDFAQRKRIKQALANMLESMTYKELEVRHDAMEALRMELSKASFYSQFSQDIDAQKDATEFYTTVCDAVEYSPMEMQTTLTPYADDQNAKGINPSKRLESAACLFVPMKEGLNLQELLMGYLNVENNDSQNPWKTDEKVELTRYKALTRFINIPEVLTISLKRYKDISKEKGKVNLVKDNSAVAMPKDDILVLPKEVLPENTAENSIEYKLVSFTMHHSSFWNFLDRDSGHYTSYNFINGEWYHHDDATVTRVSQAEVDKKKKRAYDYKFVRVREPE